MRVIPIAPKAQPGADACNDEDGRVPKLDLPLARREFLKGSGVLMGTISLFPAPELKTGWHLNTEILGSASEAGYALGRKWWNNGYMTEALCAVRDYWFNTVDAPWLAAIHANENVASSAVLQKAGFVYDHDVIDHKFDGTAVPCRAYHLVKEDL